MIKNLSLLFLALLAIYITLNPQADIAVASLFYDQNLGFIYKGSLICEIVFRAIPIIVRTYLILTISYLVFFAIYYKKYFFYSRMFYLLLALILGPGLVVNFVFKDHFGRARPSQVQEFGGNKTFTPPLSYSHQCDSNCSFSSGHASIGFYIASFAYVSRKKNRYYAAGIVSGLLIGLVRVVQGGHFLSDVLFSGIFVLMTNYFSYILWQKIASKAKDRSNNLYKDK